ncbi:MAG: type II toxin-antitoxin system VapC family toxin [Polyangiales bacterium]
MVLDASVAVKWFLPEEDTPQAMRIARALLRGRLRAVVPELFFFEVYAVVIRKHREPERWSTAGSAWLHALPLRRVPFSPSLGASMHALVQQGLTGYDATYAALATQSGLAWLTYDTKASAQLGSPDWVITGQALRQWTTQLR